MHCNCNEKKQLVSSLSPGDRGYALLPHVLCELLGDFSQYSTGQHLRRGLPGVKNIGNCSMSFCLRVWLLNSRGQSS